MSTKSTFMVIDMMSMCKHVPIEKLVQSRIIYIFAKITNWHCKRNILGKMIVLGNRCINLCPENDSQITIVC